MIFPGRRELNVPSKGSGGYRLQSLFEGLWGGSVQLQSFKVDIRCKLKILAVLCCTVYKLREATKWCYDEKVV